VPPRSDPPINDGKAPNFKSAARREAAPEGLIAGAVIGWVVRWFSSSLDEWLKDRRAFKEMDRRGVDHLSTISVNSSCYRRSSTAWLGNRVVMESDFAEPRKPGERRALFPESLN
jgi:hypothetical protein